MSQATVEDRLAALEREMAELKSQVSARAPAPPSSNWLSAITGSMKGTPGFDEVVQLGRAIRQADRPADE